MDVTLDVVVCWCIERSAVESWWLFFLFLFSVKTRLSICDKCPTAKVTVIIYVFPKFRNRDLSPKKPFLEHTIPLHSITGIMCVLADFSSEGELKKCDCMGNTNSKGSHMRVWWTFTCWYINRTFHTLPHTTRYFHPSNDICARWVAFYPFSTWQTNVLATHTKIIHRAYILALGGIIFIWQLSYEYSSNVLKVYRIDFWSRKN